MMSIIYDENLNELCPLSAWDLIENAWPANYLWLMMRRVDDVVMMMMLMIMTKDKEQIKGCYECAINELCPRHSCPGIYKRFKYILLCPKQQTEEITFYGIHGIWPIFRTSQRSSGMNFKFNCSDIKWNFIVAWNWMEGNEHVLVRLSFLRHKGLHTIVAN